MPSPSGAPTAPAAPLSTGILIQDCPVAAPSRVDRLPSCRYTSPPSVTICMLPSPRMAPTPACCDDGSAAASFDRSMVKLDCRWCRRGRRPWRTWCRRARGRRSARTSWTPWPCRLAVVFSAACFSASAGSLAATTPAGVRAHDVLPAARARRQATDRQRHRRTDRRHPSPHRPSLDTVRGPLTTVPSRLRRGRVGPPGRPAARVSAAGSRRRRRCPGRRRCTWRPARSPRRCGPGGAPACRGCGRRSSRAGARWRWPRRSG